MGRQDKSFESVDRLGVTTEGNKRQTTCFVTKVENGFIINEPMYTTSPTVQYIAKNLEELVEILGKYFAS